jgi:serine protease inhibitor
MVNQLYPYIHFKMNEGFVTEIRKSFLSDVKQIDYSNRKQATETINEGVKFSTRNKIQNIVSSDRKFVRRV